MRPIPDQRLPIDVSGRAPQWMTAPAAGSLEVSRVATLPLEVLRAVVDRLDRPGLLHPAVIVTDPPPLREGGTVVRAEQLHFARASPSEPPDLDQVVIDPETTKAAITLIARVLPAVVRAVQEADDVQ